MLSPADPPALAALQKALQEGLLAQFLAQAVEELRQGQTKPALPLRASSKLRLAAAIEEAAASLADGDPAAVGTLYLMFAPQSDWDDAKGSLELGNRLCELLHPLWVAAR